MNPCTWNRGYGGLTVKYYADFPTAQRVGAPEPYVVQGSPAVTETRVRVKAMRNRQVWVYYEERVDENCWWNGCGV